MKNTQVFGRIKSVAEESLAWEAGLEPGDELRSINSLPVRDILEYEYRCLDDELLLDVSRGGEILQAEISRYDDEDLGIEFEGDLFDGLHSCRNNCVFCFLHQMPKGLRKSLYVRDDDYRLSLAHGNYITLTNVGDDELDRICSQKMSPIYVSVHATEPYLRAAMLRNRSAAPIMDQLTRLASARISMHTQIVLCRGINDGKHLERTIADLTSLHPWVQSIGVVPVGLTKYREGLTEIERFDGESARQVVEQCSRWQRKMKRSIGSKLVFPSDEFYLLSESDIPSASSYEGFPQLENGIGLSRVFLDELRWIEKRVGRLRPGTGRYVLVTGTLAAPMVQRLANAMNAIEGVNARVCIVKNRFLGESITVTGLLTGGDVAEAISGASADEEILIPDVALNEDRFLDDLTVQGLQERCAGRITVVPSFPRGLVERITSVSDTAKSQRRC